MQPWVWLVAYVTGFGLLQVLLYRHFSARTPTPKTTEGHAERAGGHATATTGDAEVLHCGHCGTVNESHSMVRYCRSCAESLR